MDVLIRRIEETTIPGVRVTAPGTAEPYNERYFRWTAFPIASTFKSSEIVCGMLEGWHHTPTFSEIEFHDDKELFYFTDGPAIMLFCQIRDGRPEADTCTLVRLEAGTELEIQAGVGHFIAVAEGEHFGALVISPRQAAPRIQLPEEVRGYEIERK